MKKHLINIIQSNIAIFLIFSFGIIAYTKIGFIHQHLDQNGRVVSHSHPFNQDDESPFKSHTHSNNEYLIYHQVNLLFFQSIIGNEFFNPIERRNIPIFKNSNISEEIFSDSKGRSPPLTQ